MAERNRRGQIQWDENAGVWSVNGDRVFGKIDWSNEEGTAVIIDGHMINASELAHALATFEGWYFELRFIDPADVEKSVPGVQ